MSIRINNKVKQFFSGGWGEKAEFLLPKEFGNEEPRQTNKRKKKKVKRDWFAKHCPFCGDVIKRLPDDEKQFSWRRRYDSSCKCGAKEVEDCPCCHRETWMKDEVYAHSDTNWCSCGFRGIRRKQ